MRSRFPLFFGALVTTLSLFVRAQDQAPPGAAQPAPADPAPVDPATADSAPPPADPGTVEPTAAEVEGADPAPADAPPADNGALRGPLLLQAEGFDDDAAVEELRAALSAEFGCLVLLRADESRFAPTGRLVVARHPEAQELAVSFVDAAGQSSTRVVQEPAEATERTRLVILLAGTLARSPLEEEASATGDQPIPASVVATPPPPPPTVPAALSLFFPLATNFDQPDAHTYFALNLLYGRIGSLDGLGLGVLQFASRDVQGAQAAFLGNAAGGEVSGVQLALGANSAGSVSGVQAAVVNHAARGMNGVQLGFFNYAAQDVLGVQGGLSINIARNVDGAQVGLLNYTAEDVLGAQAGLSINIARNVRGGQVGLINVGRRVEGLQLGLINVADDVDGVPIGLISVTKDGGVHPLAWYSSVTALNAGLKFATKYTYTFINASYDPYSNMVGPGGGIGGSVPGFIDRLFVDIDAGGTYLFRDSGPADNGRTLARLRATFRYQILPHLSVFAGGGYAGKVERADDGTGEYFYESLGEFVAGIGL